MKLIKKFFTAFFLSFFILNLSNVTFAEMQEISAEGEYRLGDRDSRETAKFAALADAKRKIIEQVGVYVESYSEMNQFNLTQDQIRTAANAMIKVKHEEVHYYENGTLCKAFVVANIDTDNIGKYIVLSGDNETDTKKERKISSKNTDKNILKLAGMEEYNGHYYKVFNEGIDWKQSKKRCEEMGGHLVTITSKEEQAVILKLIFLNGEKFHYWAGGIRDAKNNFKWITGEKFIYSNWHNGEPNNAGDIEDAIVIVKQTGGTWNDLSSKAAGIYPDGSIIYQPEYCGFICEWDSYEDIKI